MLNMVKLNNSLYFQYNILCITWGWSGSWCNGPWWWGRSKVKIKNWSVNHGLVLVSLLFGICQTAEGGRRRNMTCICSIGRILLTFYLVPEAMTQNRFQSILSRYCATLWTLWQIVWFIDCNTITIMTFRLVMKIYSPIRFY